VTSTTSGLSFAIRPIAQVRQSVHDVDTLHVAGICSWMSAGEHAGIVRLGRRRPSSFASLSTAGNHESA
jgi:hypothetical protein